MPRESSAAQKDRIRRKAAQLFAKRGYHGTGVQELSEAVGLGRGSLYHHIGSKEALLFEISTAHIYELIDLGEELLAAQDLDAETKLRRLSAAHMKAVTEHRDEWTVFERDAMTLDGKLREQIIACRDRFEAIWAAIVEQGVEAGEFKRVDPVALKGMLGMQNYAYMWARPGGRLTPEQIGDVFCDLIFDGLRQEAS
jgi:AcrR family transcriptional regulator